MNSRRPREIWAREIWLDAMFESEDPALKPAERVMATVYARYAGKSDTTWCTDEELMRRMGVRSRDTVYKARTTLITKGWLTEVEPPRQHKSGRYKLEIPIGSKEKRRP